MVQTVQDGATAVAAGQRLREAQRSRPIAGTVRAQLQPFAGAEGRGAIRIGKPAPDQRCAERGHPGGDRLGAHRGLEPGFEA